MWAARDQRFVLTTFPTLAGKLAFRKDTYVAVKISVAENENQQQNRQVCGLKTLAATQTRPQHVMSMIDDFDLTGPNGSHTCIVLDLVGPNVPDIIETNFSDSRLAGHLAKRIAKQALIGLDTLH